MNTQTSQKLASRMAELTFQLLVDCQLKEERLAKQFDISVPDFRTLRMFREDRQLHIKTLVERIGLSGSRLTRILDDLERKGFLTRSIDPNDRRSMIVALTPKGSSLAEHLENRFVQIHEEILNGIPEGLHEPLLAGLDKMLSSLEYWLGNS